MLSQCCQSIWLWILHFFTLIAVGIVTMVLIFLVLAGRPDTDAFELELNLQERLLAAKGVIIVLALVVAATSIGQLGRGEHRCNNNYEMEADFKILTILVLLTTLASTVLGVVGYSMAGLETPVVTPTFPSPTKSPIGAKRVDKVLLVLLVLDIVALVLAVLGIVIVYACNKKEKYDVEKYSRVSLSSSDSLHTDRYSYRYSRRSAR